MTTVLVESLTIYTINFSLSKDCCRGDRKTQCQMLQLYEQSPHTLHRELASDACAERRFNEVECLDEAGCSSDYLVGTNSFANASPPS